MTCPQTCGLVLVCLAMSPAVAVMIVQGCSGMCWCACLLQSAIVPLRGVLLTAGVASSVSNNLQPSSPATTGTGTGATQIVNTQGLLDSLKKVGAVWGVAVLVCWVGSVTLGLYIICRTNLRPLTSGPTIFKSTTAASSLGKRRLRTPGLPRGRQPRGGADLAQVDEAEKGALRSGSELGSESETGFSAIEGEDGLGGSGSERETIRSGGRRRLR